MPQRHRTECSLSPKMAASSRAAPHTDKLANFSSIRSAFDDLSLILASSLPVEGNNITHQEARMSSNILRGYFTLLNEHV